VVEAAILADYDPEVVSGVLDIAVLHGSTVLKEVFCWIMQEPVHAGGKKSVNERGEAALGYDLDAWHS
jgi:hypothetical protein